jgi:hypothetical protein
VTDDDWRTLFRMLTDMGLEITGFSRASSTLTVRVPSLRETRKASGTGVHEWDGPS